MVKAGLIASLLIMAAPVLADAPLTPRADFVAEFDRVVVIGDVARNTTTIQPRYAPAWVIPIWARSYMLSPDSTSILVFPETMNLLSSDDPAQIVATVWYLESANVRAQRFALGDLMDPSDMPRSISHFIWLESRSLSDLGWVIGLSDGKTITITFR